MNEKILRTRLQKHLNGGEAFANLKSLMDKASFEKVGEQPNNLPYSVFEQFYHIRFTQLDILKFIQEEDYKAPC